jgi:hypothetical protein
VKSLLLLLLLLDTVKLRIEQIKYNTASLLNQKRIWIDSLTLGIRSMSMKIDFVMYCMMLDVDLLAPQHILR